MQKVSRMKHVLIALLVGLVVTLIAYQALGAKGAQQAPAVIEKVPVVYAKAAIAARTKLTAEMVAVREVPKEALVGTEFSKLDEVLGLITTVPLVQGEALLPSKAVQQEKGTLPYRIPADRRAVTIKTDEVAGVAGYPEPGDRVDVILFLKPVNNGPATARLLLEDIPVLARAMNPGEAQGKTTGDVKITSLTLAVTPEAAVELALAEQLGTLKVALRRAEPDGKRGNVVMSQTRWDQQPAPAPPTNTGSR